MRLRQLYLMAGIAIGYVLGTRAGRERYEELTDAARRVVDRPDVQSAAGMVADRLSRTSRQAMAALGGRVSEETRDRVSRAPFAVISKITPTPPADDEGEVLAP